MCAELRRLDWATPLSEETLTAVSDAAEWVEFRAGEIIIGVDTNVIHVFFLITGRLHGSQHLQTIRIHSLASASGFAPFAE
jgi:hypothetical protein